MVPMAISQFRATGYTSAILHASEAGRPVYSKAGFNAGHEMRLSLG
jgi:hypothetical protein